MPKTSMAAPSTGIGISVAIGSGHPDYPDNLGHFLPRHTYISDPNPKYSGIMCIVIFDKINTL